MERAGCRGPGSAIPMLKKSLESRVVHQQGAHRPNVVGGGGRHAVDRRLLAGSEGWTLEYTPRSAVPALDHLVRSRRPDTHDSGGPGFGGRNVHHSVKVTGVVAMDRRRREGGPLSAVEVNGRLTHSPDIGGRRCRHGLQSVIGDRKSV